MKYDLISRYNQTILSCLYKICSTRQRRLNRLIPPPLLSIDCLLQFQLQICNAKFSSIATNALNHTYFLFKAKLAFPSQLLSPSSVLSVPWFQKLQHFDSSDYSFPKTNCQLMKILHWHTRERKNYGWWQYKFQNFRFNRKR